MVTAITAELRIVMREPPRPFFQHTDLLESRGIDTADIERVGGETFFWRGHYEHDLNVAHTEDDLANPKPNRGKKGFTDEERGGRDRPDELDPVEEEDVRGAAVAVPVAGADGQGLAVDRDGNVWVTDGSDNLPRRAQNAPADAPLPPARRPARVPGRPADRLRGAGGRPARGCPR